MANSVRLEILKYLTTAIAAEITPANGYDFDLTNAVFRGRVEFGSDDPLPAASILESPDADPESQYVGFSRTERKDRWLLLLQGWSAIDATSYNPTDDAANLLASLKKAVAKIQRAVSERELTSTPMSNVDKILIGPGVARPPDQLSPVGYCWLRLIVEVMEKVDDPFWTPP